MTSLLTHSVSCIGPSARRENEGIHVRNSLCHWLNQTVMWLVCRGYLMLHACDSLLGASARLCPSCLSAGETPAQCCSLWMILRVSHTCGILASLFIELLDHKVWSGSTMQPCSRGPFFLYIYHAPYIANFYWEQSYLSYYGVTRLVVMY